MSDLDPIYQILSVVLLFIFFILDVFITAGVLYVVPKVLRYYNQNYKAGQNVSIRSSIPAYLLFLAAAVLVYLMNPFPSQEDQTLFLLLFIFLSAYFIKILLLYYYFRKTYKEKAYAGLKGFFLTIYLLAGSWVFILLLSFLISTFFILYVPHA